LTASEIDALRAVLNHIQNPGMLDAHPWVLRPFVKDAVARSPKLQQASPGAQLVGALGDLFEKMIPAMPPRRGKRLDTHWGEFGLLAAQYFAPRRFGTPVPVSMRDAWGRMDRAILLYVFGSEADALTPAEVETYKLVGDEAQVAPASTLSDWHTKGMEKLLQTLDAHEQFLAQQRPASDLPRRRRKVFKVIAFLLLAILALALAWFGVKGWRIYRLATTVYQEATQLRQQASRLDLETARTLGPSLGQLRKDLQLLKNEAAPFITLGPRLGWVPEYGGDLAAAPDLVILADSLLASADQTYRALSPILDAYASGTFDPERWTKLLNVAQPQLTEARTSLDLARDARTRLDPSRLSPRLRPLLEDVDRALPVLADGILLAQEAPRLLGASSDGPKTYLLLAQNEDELRPTGGFITAAATLLIRDGRILSLTFQNSADFDNWQRPYPRAPWQLQQYMNSPVLIFRDANWFTDFRTSAQYAEYLYSYANEHSVDGVIAFNQHALVELLRIVGPVRLEGQTQLIDADNVIAFMRAEKSNHTDVSTESNKAFINDITAALLGKLFSGDVPPYELAQLLVRLLNEKHVLLQLDNPSLTDFLARRGWDGALRAGEGDFLMVVDANIGFNKTNAVVHASLSYDVDLTNLEAPRSQLVVTHQNNASAQVPCLHYPYLSASELSVELVQNDYPIDRCYWDYLRVYVLADTDLLGATVQTVPAEWTFHKRTVPPQVDVLEEEKLDGLHGFGTFKVVPGGQSLASGFRFALPSDVLTRGADSRLVTYRLKVQKAAGTVGVALTVRVHVPDGASVQTVPPGAVVEGQNVLIQSALVTDLQFEYVFLLP